LQYAEFKQERLEERYLKKVKHLFKDKETTRIFDDTLDYREGKHIEESQYHQDHCSNKNVRGHQFFTAMLFCGNFQLPVFPRLYSKSSETKLGLWQMPKEKENRYCSSCNTCLISICLPKTVYVS
jgi:hypothetical protein